MRQGFVADAYHGTRHSFRSFVPSERGTFGPGIYFGSTLQQGVIFSGEEADSMVLTVRVTISRPFHYKVAEPEEVDSWGEGLVKQIFGGASAAKAIESALHGDGQFGREIYDELERCGHDGVVATFEDGSQEIMALYPDQCEILESHTLDEVYANHPNLFGEKSVSREELQG